MFVRRSSSLALAGALLSLAALSACKQGPQAPKVPLAQASAPAQSGGDVQAPTMPAAARAALDSGNSAFRQKKYDVALDQYRAAEKVVPNDVAPYFGEYMVAQKLNNKALADSAMVNVKRLSTKDSPMLSDSGLQSMHAGKLPSGHPTTSDKMPSGHPALPLK